MASFDEEELLEKTIKLAESALLQGNFPIGAILADENGVIVAECINENTTSKDITAHAEILCLRKATQDLLAKNNGKSFFLYTSLEPCGGCSFFVARTNIQKVVSISNDPFRPGLSYLKNDNEFADTFKNVRYIESNNIDLKKRSLLLMRDYFLKLGAKDKADIYERFAQKIN